MCFSKFRKKNDNDTLSESPVGGSIGSLKDPKILIIGAGAAGIACATKLLSFGFKDVIIYEAENRIGGRINTIQFADNVVDMGAQWCHGENMIYQMFKDLNLFESDDHIYNSCDYISSGGIILDNDTVSRLQDIVMKINVLREEELKTYMSSYGEYLEEKFFDIFNNGDYDDIHWRVAREFFINLLKIEGAETAISLNDVSGQGFLEYWSYPGDYLLNWKNTGFINFINLLTKSDKLGNNFGVLEKNLHLNKYVNKIIWDRSDGRIEVKTEDGKNIIVDHVVLTVSLGVLKQNIDKMFKPHLPEFKHQAIRSIGYGSVCKIYLEFPKRWWSRTFKGFNAVWTLFDIETISKTPGKWLLDILGFYCVSQQPRVLIAWLIGIHVPMVEQMDKAQVLRGIMFMLKKFLPKHKILKVDNIEISTWATNRNFLGTYSFPSMSTLITGPCHVRLSQPVTVLAYAPMETDVSYYKIDDDEDERPLTVKPLLLFAGEATSEHYFSTVHGAVESGFREAKRLAGYYEKEL